MKAYTLRLTFPRIICSINLERRAAKKASEHAARQTRQPVSQARRREHDISTVHAMNMAQGWF